MRCNRFYGLGQEQEKEVSKEPESNAAVVEAVTGVIIGAVLFGAGLARRWYLDKLNDAIIRGYEYGIAQGQAGIPYESIFRRGK